MRTLRELLRIINRYIFYYIRNSATGKYITIPDGYYYVDQEAYTGASNQLWKVHYNNDGTYGLSNAARSGYYMYAGVDTEGGSIQIDNSTGSLPNDCRMWIIPTAKGNFRITSREIGQFRALTGGCFDSTSVEAYNAIPPPMTSNGCLKDTRCRCPAVKWKWYRETARGFTPTRTR